MQDVQTSLSSSPYFKDLSPSELKTILELGTKHSYRREDLLVKESDKGDTVFFILSGRLDVSVSLVGSTETEKIATVTKGELVGEMILLGKTRRSANLRAKEDVDVYVWTVNNLLGFFDKNQHCGYVIMRNIAAILADRLAATNQVLRNVLTFPKNVLM